MPESKTSKRRIIAEERRIKAFELRKAGATYRQIAAKIGVSPQSIHKSITKAMKDNAEISAEKADDVRAMEIERIDAMLLGIWSRATNGDTKAIDTAMRLSKRRSELLGLDAPQRIEMSHEDRLAELE